jgi:hypothetical protein
MANGMTSSAQPALLTRTRAAIPFTYRRVCVCRRELVELCPRRVSSCQRPQWHPSISIVAHDRRRFTRARALIQTTQGERHAPISICVVYSGGLLLRLCCRPRSSYEQQPCGQFGACRNAARNSTFIQRTYRNTLFHRIPDAQRWEQGADRTTSCRSAKAQRSACTATGPSAGTISGRVADNLRRFTQNPRTVRVRNQTVMALAWTS